MVIGVCVGAIIINIWLSPTITWYSSGNLVSSGVALGAFALWVSLVSEKWVKDASEAYTRALLAACEAEPKTH